MGFFSKRPGKKDLGTMEGNPSDLDAVEDLPLIEKVGLVATGGMGLAQEAAEVSTTQDIGRDLQDDIDATDSSEEQLFDEVAQGEPDPPEG